MAYKDPCRAGCDKREPSPVALSQLSQVLIPQRRIFKSGEFPHLWYGNYIFMILAMVEHDD